MLDDIQLDLSAYSTNFDDMSVYLIEPGTHVSERPDSDFDVPNAMQQYADDHNNATYISTYDLTSYGDEIHFDASSIDTIGTRLFNEVIPEPSSLALLLTGVGFTIPQRRRTIS